MDNKDVQVSKTNANKFILVSRLISLLTKNLIIFYLLTVIASRPAYAYLDPGTGSLITQTLAGFLLAAIFSFKLWARKVKRFFKKKKASDSK